MLSLIYNFAAFHKNVARLDYAESSKSFNQGQKRSHINRAMSDRVKEKLETALQTFIYYALQ